MTAPDWAGKVVIANVHGSSVAPSYAYSLIGLREFDLGHENRLVDINGKMGIQASFAGPMQIPRGRNDMCARFLEMHEAEWLFFLDSDMGIDNIGLEMLIASADPVERPVVGGLCFAHKVVGVGAAHAFRAHFYPTIYTWTEEGDDFGFNPILEYQRDALVQVAGTGGACLLIHRTVLERMEERWPGGQWFRPITYRDRDFSEDLSFCMRSMILGIPMFVNTAVKTSHAKTVWIDEEFVDLLRRNSRRNVFVVLPVKGQWEMTRSILRQLQQGGNYAGVLVYDNGCEPEMRAWLDAQDVAEVFDAQGLNIHQMWNRGIEQALSRDPGADVAILNNDLKLGPDFLARMQDALHSDPALLAVSANYDGRQFPGLVQPVREICAARYDGTGGFAGFAFLVRNDFVKDYRFPEDLVWWYGDNDMLATIEAFGGWYGIAKQAVCEHLDGGSATSRTLDPEQFAKQCAVDREWFLAKWRGETADAVDDPEPAPAFLDVGGHH